MNSDKIPLSHVIKNLHEKLSRELELYSYKGIESSIVHEVADNEEAVEKVLSKPKRKKKVIDEAQLKLDPKNTKNIKSDSDGFLIDAGSLIKELKELGIQGIDDNGQQFPLDSKEAVTKIALLFRQWEDSFGKGKVPSKIFNAMSDEKIDDQHVSMAILFALLPKYNITKRKEEEKQKAKDTQTDLAATQNSKLAPDKNVAGVGQLPTDQTIAGKASRDASNAG